MLTELQKVHDALGCPKNDLSSMPFYFGGLSILLPTFEYMIKIFLSSMPLHGTPRKNVICFAV